MVNSGQIVKALKSLEISLKEKLRVYQNDPEHPSIWLVAKTIADIALKFAVKCLNDRKFEQAFTYLKVV